MYQHLTRLALSKPPTQDWTEAKERFTDALARERKLAAERAAAYRACFDPVDAVTLDDARKATRDAETARTRAQAAHRGLRRRSAELKDQHAALYEKSRAHDEAKPGRAARLLARENVRQWRQDADALAAEIDKLEESIRAVRAKVRTAGAAATEAAAKATKARRTARRTRPAAARRCQAARRRQAGLATRVPGHLAPGDARGPGASRPLG